MAVNGPRTAGGALTFSAGDGIEISGGVITNTMSPPSQVLDNTITSPSGVTDFGSSYIVPAGATGAWAGQTNNIASTSDGGATWDFLAPANGTRRLVNGGPNAGSTYQFNSATPAWVAASAGTVAAGTVLKVTEYSATQITVAGSGTSAVTFTRSYTPASTSSILLIDFDADYNILGFGSDEYRGRIMVAGAQIRDKRQRFDGSGGGGTRSSTMLPISGRVANTTAAAKSIQVILDRIAGDDNINIFTDRLMRITEIKA